MPTLLPCPPSAKAEAIERFEATAGELLDELGYSRAVPHPRSESLEGASKFRNVLARNLGKLTRSEVPVQAAPLTVQQQAEANEARSRVQF
jgi:hypothetical protein